MNASFYNYLPYEGKAAIVSQSGALLIAMAAATYTRRVGFDKMISIGNQADLDFADLISYLNEDENTSCLTLYIEGIKDGPKFMEAARQCTKPIIASKPAHPPTAQLLPHRTPAHWLAVPRFTRPLLSKQASPRLKT